LLKSRNNTALEPQTCLEILSDFTNKMLKREFSSEKLNALLIFTDLSQCNCFWSESVWLLHSAGCRS
ncbi:hypothetical protein RYX36_034008, partial [Vicia faba]